MSPEAHPLMQDTHDPDHLWPQSIDDDMRANEEEPMRLG